MTLLKLFFYSLFLLGADSVFRQAPETLHPVQESLSLKTRVKFFDGKSGQLEDLMRKFSGIVFIARDANCPVSRLVAPALRKLEKEYNKKLAFIFVNFDKHEISKGIKADIDKFGFEGPYISDPNFELNKLLKLKTTTEVVLVNRKGQIVYRGAVTDAAGIGYVKKQGTATPFLKDAINAFLNKQPILKSRTSAPGCILSRPTLQKSPKIDFADVKPIFAGKCVRCHHEGGIGPFSLRSYKQIYNRLGMIKFVIENRIMPPWFADDGTGPFRNNYDLTASERRKMIEWANAGGPNKNSLIKSIPAPKAINKTRDRLFHFKDIEVPATGLIPYKYLTISVGNSEPVWIQSVLISNKEPKTLHHVVFGTIRKGKNPAFIGGIAPGADNTLWNGDNGILLPANAVISLQVHYTAIGRQFTDSITFGFNILKKPPKKRISITLIENKDFLLPANSKNIVVKKELIIREPKTLAAIAPHMHYRGARSMVTALYPNGKTKVLYSGRFDFNWQPLYRYATPIKIPAGTKLSFQATFDNSRYNLANPNPNKAVTYGESSTDEMMALICVWVEDSA